MSPRSINSANQVAVLLLLVLLAPASLFAAERSLDWVRDLAKATDLARETNKPLLLDFWADWCAPCKVMEKEVYSDSGVIDAASDKFILVKIDFDKQPELARRYNVTALPHLVFTDSYGTELFSHHGMIDARTFAAAATALPADVSEFNRLDQILSGNKNDFEALREMGRALRAAGLYVKSNEYYAKSLKTGGAKQAPSRESVLLEMGLNYLVLRQSAEAAKTFESALKQYPASKNSSAFLLNLAQAYAMDGKNDRARRAIETLLRNDPEGPEARHARELLQSL